MSAVPSTSTKGDGHHAEPTDDGKTASHAVARHGGSFEGAAARSGRQRTELLGTALAAGRSTMDLAREPGTGAKTESSQAEGSGLRGGHRLSGRTWPGQDGGACSGKRLRLGPQSREHFRVGSDRRGQELYRFGPGAEGLSRRPLGSLSAGGSLAAGAGLGPSRLELAPPPRTTESDRRSGHR